MTWVGLLFDILVCAGLAASIVYSIRLHRDVKTVLAQKEELEQFMRQVRDQIQAAERNFKNIQLASQEGATELEEDILKAKELNAELKFMLEAGESLAERLANSADRKGAKQAALESDMPKPKMMSKAEQELAQRIAAGASRS